MKKSVLICVPGYRGDVKTSLMWSVWRLRDGLAKIGVNVDLAPNVDTGDIALSRNIFASRFVLEKRHTHVLMADWDQSFTPDPVRAMIEADKDVIAAVIPQRGLDLDKAFEHAKTMPAGDAIGLASSFNVVPAPAAKFERGIFEAEKIGMGLALISRAAFEQLIESKTLRVDEDPGPQMKIRTLFGFFDVFYENNKLVMEDFAFCRRYRSIGRKVWALGGHRIGHIGDFVFEAEFTEKLLKPRQRVSLALAKK